METNETPAQEQTSNAVENEEAVTENGDTGSEQPKNKADDTPETSEPEKQFLFQKDDDKKDGDDSGEEEVEKDESEDGSEEAQPFTTDVLELPEEYSNIADDDKSFLESFAKEKNLGKEDMQKLVDHYVDMKKRDTKVWADTVESWRKDIMNDAELGGKNLPSVRARSTNAIDKFCPNSDHMEGFINVLETFGLGNNVHVVRFLNNVGAAIEDDNIGKPEGAGGEAGKSHAEVLYGAKK